MPYRRVGPPRDDRVVGERGTERKSDSVHFHTDESLTESMSRITRISSRMEAASVGGSELTQDLRLDWLGVWQISGHSRWNGEYMVVRRKMRAADCHDSDSLETFDPKIGETMHRFVIDENPAFATWIFTATKKSHMSHKTRSVVREYSGKLLTLAKPLKIEWVDKRRHRRVDDWVKLTGDSEKWLRFSFPKIRAESRAIEHRPAAESRLQSRADSSGTWRRVGDASATRSARDSGRRVGPHASDKSAASLPFPEDPAISSFTLPKIWSDEEVAQFQSLRKALRTEPGIMHAALVQCVVTDRVQVSQPRHCRYIIDLIMKLPISQIMHLLEDREQFEKRCSGIVGRLIVDDREYRVAEDRVAEDRVAEDRAPRTVGSHQRERDRRWQPKARDIRDAERGTDEVPPRHREEHKRRERTHRPRTGMPPVYSQNDVNAFQRRYEISKHFSGPRQVVRGVPSTAPGGKLMPRKRGMPRSVGRKRRTERSSRGRQFYDEHLPPDLVKKGVEKGLLFIGQLGISRHNAAFAFVTVKGFEKDIRVLGLKHRNRAFAGDMVAVSLFPVSEWMPDTRKELIEFEARMLELEAEELDVDAAEVGAAEKKEVFGSQSKLFDEDVVGETATGGSSASDLEEISGMVSSSSALRKDGDDAVEAEAVGTVESTEEKEQTGVGKETEATEDEEEKGGKEAEEEVEEEASGKVLFKSPQPMKSQKRRRIEELENPLSVTAMEVFLGRDKAKASDRYPDDPDSEECFGARGKVFAITHCTKMVKHVDGWIQPQYVGKGRDRRRDKNFAFFIPFNRQMPKARMALFRTQVDVLDALLEKHADYELGRVPRTEVGATVSGKESADGSDFLEIKAADLRPSKSEATKSAAKKWRRKEPSATPPVTASSSMPTKMDNEDSATESELLPSEILKRAIKKKKQQKGRETEEKNPVTQELRNLIVEVEYERKWQANSVYPYCHMVSVLGERGQLQVETKIILNNNNISHTREFDERIEKYVESCEVTEEDYCDRLDIRDKFVITIDPTTGRDFDDAISIWPSENGKGLYRVGVHIADVTHFVKNDTLLDTEARLRATSVYLVEQCLPMLPEKLSNGLCSLNPCEDKLCYSAMCDMNGRGEVVFGEDSPWFGRTVINSKARLNYETANRLIETPMAEITEDSYKPAAADFVEDAADAVDAEEEEEKDAEAAASSGGKLVVESEAAATGGSKQKAEEESESGLFDACCTLESSMKPKLLAKKVKLLWRLAKQRRDARFAVGSVAFSRASVRFRLNPENHEALLACPDSGLKSNKLVEDFMLLANQLVARFLVDTLGPRALLRKHPPPDAKKGKMSTLIARSQGIRVDLSSSKALNTCLEQLEGVEKDGICMLEIVSTLTLTAMTRAEYFCVDETDEAEWRHWGLCFATYTHFTSPIRRYADVMVHRLLSAAIASEAAPGTLEDDQFQCRQCNTMSKRAADAGSDSKRLHLCLLLRDKCVFADAMIVEMRRMWVSAIVAGFGLKVDIRLHRLEQSLGNIQGQMPDCTLNIAWDGGEEEKYELFDKVRVKLYSLIRTPIELVATIVPPKERDTSLPFTMAAAGDCLPLTTDMERAQSVGQTDTAQCAHE